MYKNDPCYSRYDLLQIYPLVTNFSQSSLIEHNTIHYKTHSLQLFIQPFSKLFIFKYLKWSDFLQHFCVFKQQFLHRGEGIGNPLHTLAWKIPWMEEPGRLQSTGSLEVGHD